MKEKLVVVLGPTGVGKTALSLRLAKEMNGEIVSCDSMQIYRYMDIGSDKILKSEQDGVVHHMLDIVDPDEDFSVSDYKKQASRIISDINNRGKVPILVGGTGLYINSLVYKLNFTEVKANPKLREGLEKEALEKGNDFIHDKLKQIDPESAATIHPNDLKRVIRAIEIFQESGVTMAEYNKNFRQPNPNYNLFMIGLNMDRAKLYKRINIRVDEMIENGLVEEVKNLLKKGYSKNLISLQGIGYKELIEVFEERISMEDGIELIKKKSRNYAKRQLTWFRRDSRISWYNKDAFQDEVFLEDKILYDLKTFYKVD